MYALLIFSFIKTLGWKYHSLRTGYVIKQRMNGAINSEIWGRNVSPSVSALRIKHGCKHDNDLKHIAQTTQWLLKKNFNKYVQKTTTQCDLLDALFTFCLTADVYL